MGVGDASAGVFKGAGGEQQGNSRVAGWQGRQGGQEGAFGQEVNSVDRGAGGGQGGRRGAGREGGGQGRQEGYMYTPCKPPVQEGRRVRWVCGWQ